MNPAKTNSDEPLWQLSYRLTREDIAAFEFLPRELIGRFRTPESLGAIGREKMWVLGPVLACGAAAGYFQDYLKSWLPWNPATGLGQLLSVIIAIGVGYAVGAILLTARARGRIARAVIPAQPTTFDAYPDRFDVSDGASVRSHRWGDVRVIGGGPVSSATQEGSS